MKADLYDVEAYIYVIETDLIQRLFNDLMPSEKVAVMAAYNDKVSYLTEEEQQILWNIVESQGLKIKPAYTERLRKEFKNLTEEKMSEILEALQVKHLDGNSDVNLKLPKAICKVF